MKMLNSVLILTMMNTCILQKMASSIFFFAKKLHLLQFCIFSFMNIDRELIRIAVFK